jgi:hypothetical protein
MERPRALTKPHRRTRLGLGLSAALIALALLAGHAVGRATAEPTHRVLRIAWEQDLPPYPNGPAMDIRWASDRSTAARRICPGARMTSQRKLAPIVCQLICFVKYIISC